MTKHLVLVHSSGHGAWYWYKVATLLQSAGYHVTALDLAASGIDMTQIANVPAFNDYSRPLLDLVRRVPAGEKDILVGHSFGGVSLALVNVTGHTRAAVSCLGEGRITNLQDQELAIAWVNF